MQDNPEGADNVGKHGEGVIQDHWQTGTHANIYVIYIIYIVYKHIYQ